VCADSMVRSVADTGIACVDNPSCGYVFDFVHSWAEFEVLEGIEGTFEGGFATGRVRFVANDLEGLVRGSFMDSVPVDFFGFRRVVSRFFMERKLRPTIGGVYGIWGFRLAFSLWVSWKTCKSRWGLI
jgi:hypothetical protein